MDEPFKGKVVIAPEVLMTIARLAALSVSGVTDMARVPGEVNRLFGRRPVNEGVRLVVRNHTVRADLYIIVGAGANLRDIGAHVQSEVARAIQEMVGMDVEAVNVHIEDVSFSGPSA